MNSKESVSQPRFEALETPPGVRLVDPIDGGQFSLLSSEPFDPTPRETDSLPIPVDGVVEANVEELRTPYLVGLWIRDENFELVDQVSGGDRVSLEAGRYVVEFSAVQLKVYLSIDGAFDVDATGDVVSFSMERTTEVLIGIRSYHEQPARTITTTDAPRDVMHAISQFRSALKTTSPERSFPTLRGHPPLVELGDELSIPGGGDIAAPSMSIEVPLRWDRIVPVVPLAFYLDAAVVPGVEPKIIVDGKQISLIGDDGFESRVERILKHVFALDAVTRTEGLYNVDLHERSLIEDQISHDFGALYETPLAERVTKYLDIPFDVVQSAIPEWKLTADVEPRAENVPVLPFLAQDLAVVRCPESDDIDPRVVTDPSPDVDQFFREDPVLVRGTSTARSDAAGNQASLSQRVFRPATSDSLMHTFVGDGIPMGATKMTPEAFRRRLAHEPAEPGRITVDVVNNEQAMSDESVVSDAYGAREWVEFDVSIHEELTKDELAAILQNETDFFHYIGHVEEEGFRCVDGHLDAHTLSSINVGAFLLNACNSYEQGRALVDAGALGGIVTLATIPNPTATRIGKHLARLLNTGFSIANARSILEQDERLASRYMVVGDGHANIVESKAGGPFMLSVKDVSNKSVNIDIQGYPSLSHSVGGLRGWNVQMPVSNCISPTLLQALEIDREAFEGICSMDQVPLLYQNELLWSDDPDLDLM